MSFNEIRWRVGSEVRDALDRCRFSKGLYPDVFDVMSKSETANFHLGFRVTDMKLGAWAGASAQDYEKTWYKDLIDKADKIVHHRLSFFNLEDKFLGDPIEWNCDHSAGIKSSMKLIQSVDYRNFAVNGDCKLVWEPSRHHHLVVLATAYRAGGDIKYAQAVIEQLGSWLDQCPFGRGMNWKSPMELGIRLINWVWALDLIHESGLFEGEFRSRVLHTVYLHLWEIARKYSRFSSANNHLIGEAAGVFIAASYFHYLNNSGQWKKEAKDILEREIINQIYPDGCDREHAFGYQLFVLQFFIIALRVAHLTGTDFSAQYQDRIEKMLEFIGLMTDGGGSLPIVGDADDGYVLDLGCDRMDTESLLSIGTVVFGRSDFKEWSGGYRESTWWLLGSSSRETYKKIPVSGQYRNLQSRSFEESGYYILQSGAKETYDRISVLFDCAELGYKSIAGHGHADALSFTLRVFGSDVFVDSGTYDYFTYPEWRKYFRSTRAHNTVVIDGADQSVMLGPFMWGQRAKAKCLKWEPNDQGGTVIGEHDGYTRLDDPVIHRREMHLDGASGVLLIRDEIMAQGSHAVEVYFHLSEHCRLSKLESNTATTDINDGIVFLELDPAFTVTTLKGSENPLGGWISRGYHQKVPSTTIVGRSVSNGNTLFLCRVRIR
ncbi:MAG: alginate lyase family protein [Deltaproteobacteria bacterium]|nr:alginate lyase family protein [Deltaproteobacteria bacterium]